MNYAMQFCYIVPLVMVDLNFVSGEECPGVNEVNSGPFRLLSHDLDNDTDLDLLSLNSYSDTADVLRHDGSGEYTQVAEFVFSGEPTSAVSTDLDDNGVLDIAIAVLDHSVEIFFGNGDATFSGPTSYEVGEGPIALLSFDVENDGDFDLLTLNYYSSDISVLLNDGNGNFGPDERYEVGATPVYMAASDLDLDGDIDLALALTANSSNVYVLLNNGNGTFADNHPYIYSVLFYLPGFITTADLDSDGDQDLAVLSQYNDLDKPTSIITVFRNSGSATFFAIGQYTVGVGALSSLATDLDSDGDYDLATTNSWQDEITMLINNGLATFTDGGALSTGGYPVDLESKDMDDDGAADFVVLSGASDDLEVFLNDGEGSFPGYQHYSTGLYPADMEIGDLDGDGDQDVAVANQGESTVSIYLLPLNCIPACAGDANEDGMVNPLDSGHVLSRFGCFVNMGDSACDHADTNADGVVDSLDVGYVAARFGDCE